MLKIGCGSVARDDVTQKLDPKNTFEIGDLQTVISQTLFCSPENSIVFYNSGTYQNVVLISKNTIQVFKNAINQVLKNTWRSQMAAG